MIKYISPLFFSGLILVLYLNTHSISTLQADLCARQSKNQCTSKCDACKPRKQSFSFFRDVVANVVPVLKNLH